MQAFTDFLFGGINYIKILEISDIIDITIVALIVYKLSMFIRKTNSARVAAGLLALVAVMWLSDVYNLFVINFLLRSTMELGLLAIVILFQPELRRMLEKMGSGSVLQLITAASVNPTTLDAAITQTLLACEDMSKSRTGALIVFERDNKLSEPLTTGTVINADTTAELLKNIFYDKAPLHDGAVIISAGKIEAAGCMLPMSSSVNLSKDLGMRHRAGIGVSENSDAIAIICSEETGAISVAVDGMLKRQLKVETVEALLRQELLRDDESEKKGFRFRRKSKLDGKENKQDK